MAILRAECMSMAVQPGPALDDCKVWLVLVGEIGDLCPTT